MERSRVFIHGMPSSLITFLLSSIPFVMNEVKNPVATFRNAEKFFSDLLTPYAFDYVKKQLSLKGKLACERETDTGFTVLSHKGMLIDIFE